MQPAESHSYASVVPKFDLAQAKRLFLKGRAIHELTEAAERLGNQELKANILQFEKDGPRLVAGELKPSGN